MPEGLTRSEKYVNELCNRSFLKLWTHPNPIGKKGKELCDCLVVCGQHIIIISVKEIIFKDTGDRTGWERWQRAAINKSANQIWGAERWLNLVDQVKRKDGRVIHLPPRSERKFHRVSVSLGGEQQVPLNWGDLGNGFVHVCDEKSARVVFCLLDTVTDFVEFLTDTETLMGENVKVMINGAGLEDLAAIYFHNGYSYSQFTSEGSMPDFIMIEGGNWDSLKSSEEFSEYAERIKASYHWDKLIDFYANDLLTEGMFEMRSGDVTEDQHALIEMALQPREVRAQLAQAFLEFLGKPDLKIKARMAKGYGGTTFVFLIGPISDRKIRAQELGLRCLVVRCKLPGTKIVVGIATDRPETSSVGYSSDLAYINIPELNEELIGHADGIQRELGYFKQL